MVAPINGKPTIITIPLRSLPRFKGLTGIDSFAFGKETLKPLIIESFRKLGIEIADIQLDQAAKARLMGMGPSFKDLVAQGKTAEEIFSYLELCLFTSERKNEPPALYVLGDMENNRKLAASLDQAIPDIGRYGITPEKPPAPILTNFAGEVVVQVSTFDLEGKPFAKNYQLDILIDPVQFRNILPLDPAKRLKVTASILGELKNLADKLPAARKTGHISTEMDNMVASSKNDSDFINTAITIGLEMIADTENKGINWAGATLLSKIRIPTDHPKLNDIYLSFIAALGRWSGSGSETELILKNVFSSMPAPQPIPPVSIKIIKPAELEMDQTLNMIRNARSILAEAQGIKYSVESDYRDSAEIRETTSALRTLLNELWPYTVGNPIMRMKVDELKERIDRDLEINDLWPWRYATEAGGILGFIDNIREILNKSNQGIPLTPPPIPEPAPPADLSARIAELEKKYNQIKQRSAETPLSPEEKQKRLKQLKAMGLELVYSEYNKEITVPEWLIDDLSLNTDLLIDTLKIIGKDKVKALLKEMVTSESFDIIRKYGVAPFIEMMKYFDFPGSDLRYLNWSKGSQQLIDRFGVAPFLVLADEITGDLKSPFQGLGILADCCRSAGDIITLGIFLAKKLAEYSDPRMTYQNDHLRVFSPSSKEINTVIAELDQYLSFYQRIFTKLCRPDAAGRRSTGGEFADTFNLDFPKSKNLLKKIGLPAFEGIIDRLTMLSLPPLTIINNLEILQILESKSLLNSAEDLPSVLSLLENVFSKYRDNIDRFRGSVPSNNIIELLNKTDIPFPSMCKIAGLFLISIDKTALTETQGLIADLGIEKFSAIIDALPSPARTGILYEIRECAPFIETPEDIKLFAEMANEDKPLTLDNFLKRKG